MQLRLAVEQLQMNLQGAQMGRIQAQLDAVHAIAQPLGDRLDTKPQRGSPLRLPKGHWHGALADLPGRGHAGRARRSGGQQARRKRAAIRQRTRRASSCRNGRRGSTGPHAGFLGRS